MKKKLFEKYEMHHVAPYWKLQIIGRKVPENLVVTISINSSQARKSETSTKNKEGETE